MAAVDVDVDVDQACLLHSGFRVRALPHHHSVLVRHRGTWVADVKAQLLTGIVTRMDDPAMLPPTLVQRYRAIALLVASGVLASGGTSPVNDWDNAGMASRTTSHPDAAQFLLPFDLRVPARYLPLSWQRGSGVVGVNGPAGLWPQVLVEPSNIARLRSDAVTRPRHLQSTCPAGQYARASGGCAPCTTCATGYLATTACSSTADTVCTGAAPSQRRVRACVALFCL
jgi:hypothetical protein